MSYFTRRTLFTTGTVFGGKVNRWYVFTPPLTAEEDRIESKANVEVLESLAQARPTTTGWHLVPNGAESGEAVATHDRASARRP